MEHFDENFLNEVAETIGVINDNTESSDFEIEEYEAGPSPTLRHRNPENWKQNVQKKKRLLGGKNMLVRLKLMDRLPKQQNRPEKWELFVKKKLVEIAKRNIVKDLRKLIVTRFSNGIGTVAIRRHKTRSYAQW